MGNDHSDFRARAVSALERADARTRDARANRLVWISAFNKGPDSYAGRLEQLELLEETRVCFVDGRFIATLLTATAFIEQTLVEELDSRSAPGSRRTLQLVIQSARDAGLAPLELLNKADRVREVRNPFGHFRDQEHPSTLVSRYRTRGVSPRVVLEEDARLAVEVVYGLFYATLRPAES